MRTRYRNAALGVHTKLKQAEPSTISHDREHFLVAVKEKKYNGESMLDELRSTSNNNVVNLLKVFHDFHQILDELFYIHTELQLYYGELNCGNVWLKRDGVVKLANVDDAMLNDVKISENAERKNVCTMRFVMNELMKSKTSLQNPDLIVLKYSENWLNNWEIRTFLKATQFLTLNKLKKVQIPFQIRLINSQLASRLSFERVYLSMFNSSCLYDGVLCQKKMEDFWLMCTLLTFYDRCWTFGNMTWIWCTQTSYLNLNFILSMMIWEQRLPFFPWLKFEFQ